MNDRNVNVLFLSDLGTDFFELKLHQRGLYECMNDRNVNVLFLSDIGTDFFELKLHQRGLYG